MRCALILFLALTTTATADYIRDAVARNVPDQNLRPSFEKLLRAIRRAENGSSGRHFGILHPAAKTLDQQAGWCAATCWKNWMRWQDTDQCEPYLVFLARRYAPIGAENDPSGLNENWLRNVLYFLEEK